MSRMKLFLEKYGHGIPALIYSAIYMTWFCHLEQTVTKHFAVIHMAVDDVIPCCEVFVIPYLLWFVYLAVAIVYFFRHSKQEFYQLTTFLAFGMTVFLVISTLWPNGHYLRPLDMPRDNWLTGLVAMIYRTDTATNLWPSIHVYNSLGAHFAIVNSCTPKHRRGIRIGSLIMASSIILSTVFIKQHSVFDVLTALLLGAVMYAVIYRRDYIPSLKKQTSWVQSHSSR